MKLALRPREAAQALGLSVRSVHRMLRSGRLKSHREGGARLIPLGEVEKIAGAPSVEQAPAVRVSAEAREIIRRARV